MATTDVDPQTAMTALRLLEELIKQQRKRVRELARRIHPGLSDAELGAIHAFPDVRRDPVFQYEDGLLSGLVASRLALKGRVVGARPPV
jgi:hypothetical protein